MLGFHGNARHLSFRTIILTNVRFNLSTCVQNLMNRDRQMNRRNIISGTFYDHLGILMNM